MKCVMDNDCKNKFLEISRKPIHVDMLHDCPLSYYGNILYSVICSYDATSQK